MADTGGIEVIHIIFQMEKTHNEQSDRRSSLDVTAPCSQNTSMVEHKRQRVLGKVDVLALVKDGLKNPDQPAADRKADVATDNMLRLAKLKCRHGTKDETSSTIRFVQFIQQSGNYHLLLAVRKMIRQCENGAMQVPDLDLKLKQMMMENAF